ncbi:MAG: hypothetical protein EOP38_02405 [Rubrivivax sp.]|nr:MAG: hypothetical protein EOP38_02405 [Rubrivivax sp.]
MFPKIKHLALLGLVGAGAMYLARERQRRQLGEAASGDQSHDMSSLVNSPQADGFDTAPTAEDPYPPGNPSPLPTGAAPGG